MTSSNKIMLIACGSFSPPTPMHFRMFEIAKDYFHQMGSHQVIGGIISPVHDAYKKIGLVSAKHRLAMSKIALQTSDWIHLSDWETQQEQWTRTRLTLQYHQNYLNSIINDANGTINEIIPSWLPENFKSTIGNVQLKLLCGADLLESFAVPGLWDPEDIEAILGQHGIVVISRNGSNPEKFIFDSDILSKYRKNITIITNWVANEVSSTVIRRLLSRGQSVKYLLDDYVIDYIKKQGLFGCNELKYILTPNQNEKIFLSLTENNYHNSNENFIKNLNRKNENQYIENMDETDYLISNNSMSFSDKSPIIRPKVFCCGDGLSVKSILNRPGQAVKIITDSSGTHATDHDEVGEINISTIEKATKLYKDTGVVTATRCKEDDTNLSGHTSRKCHSDLIRFVLTEHGIRVISDREYVV